MKLRHRRALRRAAKIIARFEGFRSCAYRDPVGVWTIGYGTTDPRYTKPGNCISERKARRLLRRDARPLIEPIERATKLRLRPNELAALISAGYNLGPGVFASGRSLGNALRDNHRWAIANSLLLYDNAGGQQLAGLTRRRHAERRLFLKK